MASTRAIEAVQHDLGRRLRAAREAADLSQEEIAARSAIDYKRLQRIEAGKVNVTLRTLVRITSAIGITIWQLTSVEPDHRERRRRS